MIAAATRQDLQNALERTRSSILSGMFSRNDAQSVVSQIRQAVSSDLRQLHAENQGAIRAAQTQHDQILQRLANLERALITISQQLGQMTETTKPGNNIAFTRI